jgi:hypothetical protein
MQRDVTEETSAAVCLIRAIRQAASLSQVIIATPGILNFQCSGIFTRDSDDKCIVILLYTPQKYKRVQYASGQHQKHAHDERRDG